MPIPRDNMELARVRPVPPLGDAMSNLIDTFLATERGRRAWQELAGGLEVSHEDHEMQLPLLQDAALFGTWQEQAQGGGETLSPTGALDAAQGRLRPRACQDANGLQQLTPSEVIDRRVPRMEMP